MLRRMIPRLARFRVSAPILPLTSRIVAPSPNLSSIGFSRGSTLRLFRTSTPRFTSTPLPSPRPEDSNSSLPPDATLSQRLTYLMKSYGWYAAGVYLVLSALDFTVAFIGINLLGAEQVSQAAAYVKEFIIGILPAKAPETSGEEVGRQGEVSGSHEGLYAMLVLAYTIHKTLFLPVRIGLTAAFTPRLVGWLRSRGWAGGEGARRAAQEMRSRLRSPSRKDND
ncbi:hypothetical protein V8B97DRAFT_1937632 [Scleroderma yunnanense]